MLLLTSTSDKVTATLDRAVPVDVHTSVVDLSGTTVTTDRNNTKLVDAGTVDVVVPPAASTTRNVKRLSLCNLSTSASVKVTVVHTDGVTAVALINAFELKPGKTLEVV